MLLSILTQFVNVDHYVLLDRAFNDTYMVNDTSLCYIIKFQQQQSVRSMMLDAPPSSIQYIYSSSRTTACVKLPIADLKIHFGVSDY